jgi:hypothetical protein
MHTLAQNYENDQKAIRSHGFRASSALELPNQTALQQTGPTPMRHHNPSMLSGGID